MVVNAICWINLYPVDSTVRFVNPFVNPFVGYYSLDSFIYLLNNWALMFWSGSFRFYCHCQEGKYSEKLVMLKLLGILKELSKYLYTYLFVCLFS